MKKIDTGSFILHGENPFNRDEIAELFLCHDIPYLFLRTFDGAIYEQDYYSDTPGIHWFKIDASNYEYLEKCKVAIVRVQIDWLYYWKAYLPF